MSQNGQTHFKNLVAFAAKFHSNHINQWNHINKLKFMVSE